MCFRDVRQVIDNTWESIEAGIMPSGGSQCRKMLTEEVEGCRSAHALLLWGKNKTVVEGHGETTLHCTKDCLQSFEFSER